MIVICKPASNSQPQAVFRDRKVCWVLCAQMLAKSWEACEMTQRQHWPINSARIPEPKRISLRWTTRPWARSNSSWRASSRAVPKTPTTLLTITKCKWPTKCIWYLADGRLVAGVMSREIQAMSDSLTTPIEWTTLVFILQRKNASLLKNRTNPSTKLKIDQLSQLKNVYLIRRVMATIL